MDSNQDSLLRDAQILEKLLFRNKNQHSRTKVFGYLRKLQKCLKKVNADLSSDSRAKDSDLQLIGTLSDIAFVCLRCFTMVRRDLKEKLFLPLYTTLLALSSSILYASCVLMVDYHGRCLRKSELSTLPFSVELGNSVVRGGAHLIPLEAGTSNGVEKAVSVEERSQVQATPPEIEPEKVLDEEPSKLESVVFDMVAMLGKRKKGALSEVGVQNTDRNPEPKKKKKKKKIQQKFDKDAGEEIDEIFSGVA